MTIDVKGKVKSMHDKEGKTYSASKRIRVENYLRKNALQGVFLKKEGSDYYLEVRGKNAEKLPGVEMVVRFTNRYMPDVTI